MLKDKPEEKETLKEQNGERHIESKRLDPAAYFTYTGREKSGLVFNDSELDAKKHDSKI